MKMQNAILLLVVSSLGSASAQNPPGQNVRFDLNNIPAVLAQCLKEHKLRLNYGDNSESRICLGLMDSNNEVVAGVDLHFTESEKVAKETRVKLVNELTQSDPSVHDAIRDGSLPGEEANFETKTARSTYLVFRRGSAVVRISARNDKATIWKEVGFSFDKLLRTAGSSGSKDQLMALFPLAKETSEQQQSLGTLSADEKKVRYAMLREELARRTVSNPNGKKDSLADTALKENGISARNQVIWEITQLEVPESKDLLASVASDLREDPIGRSVALNALGRIDDTEGLRLAYQILKATPPQRENDDDNLKGMAGLRNQCLRIVFSKEKRDTAVAFFQGVHAHLEAEAEMTRAEFGEQIPWLLERAK